MAWNEERAIIYTPPSKWLLDHLDDLYFVPLSISDPLHPTLSLASKSLVICNSASLASKASSWPVRGKALWDGGWDGPDGGGCMGWICAREREISSCPGLSKGAPKGSGVHLLRF